MASRGLLICVSHVNWCAPEQDASSAVGRQRWRDGLDGAGGGLRPRSVGGADGPGGAPCMTESRVPGRPHSGRGDQRTGRPSPGLRCVLHMSAPCGASGSLGEEGGPPRLHMLCWALGAWGPTCRFLVQVQRLPPGHAQAHAQGVRLHPPGARHQQGGLRQRPEHRYVPPRAACTHALLGPCEHRPGAGAGLREHLCGNGLVPVSALPLTSVRAPCFPCGWASGGTSTGSESSVWKLALPPRGVHPKVVHQVHEFRPCLRHPYFTHWLK